MRKLKRSVAHAIFKKAGYSRINKRYKDGDSFFACNWRSLFESKPTKKKHRRGKSKSLFGKRNKSHLLATT